MILPDLPWVGGREGVLLRHARRPHRGRLALYRPHAPEPGRVSSVPGATGNPLLGSSPPNTVLRALRSREVQGGEPIIVDRYRGALSASSSAGCTGITERPIHGRRKTPHGLRRPCHRDRIASPGRLTENPEGPFVFWNLSIIAEELAWHAPSARVAADGESSGSLPPFGGIGQKPGSACNEMMPEEPACKPGSVPWRCRLGCSHFSGTGIAAGLKQRPGAAVGHRRRAI